MTATTLASPGFRPLAARTGLIGLALVVIAMVALFVGVRYALMLLIGLGFGVALEGFRFGFAGPWRAMILRREPAGILAQLLSIAVVACVAIPMLASHPQELTGAQAPIGFAMIGGAFVFGAAMQVVLGCGSGTLVNAGSGNPVGLLALPFFALGSFAGAYHLIWWTNLGALPILTLRGTPGLMITLVGLALVAAVLLWLGKPGSWRLPRRYVLAALTLAALAIANLVVAGQPWGVVYGLGLWAAKGVTALGADLSGSAFYAAVGSEERLNASVLTDYTSLTNFGMIAGAFGVAAWRSGGLSQPLPSYPARAWIVTIIAGLMLGYSSRLAFGCNVGAFFSGIGTGSLHGWVWFAAAFAGAFLGIRIRAVSGLEARP
ncbi:YeeE/YedE thiosulfate transporter family protein [Loktanella sp. M215]|uniref:YeeE/YedE thiosulfate transporter family protein n=1 Tax=Loktanella sp. M215 TaxID=2675431 RepID=UPI001F3D35AF|nr:YeeE/YedE thiosulfate transporter family protein [Loktanella sp. M215]MCF7699838.1 YeeE/YedE family protein [Loktanella sp. M215]